MQLSQKNTKERRGLTQHIKSVLKPRQSLSGAMATWLSDSSRGTALPFKIEGYDFSIEHGLRLKARSTTWWWLSSKIVIIACLATLLPLLWWLSNSKASILLEPVSRLLETPTSSQKLDLLAPTFNANRLVQVPIATVNQSNVPALTSMVKNLPRPTLVQKSPSLPWLHLRIKPGDTLLQIFKTHQLNKTQLYQMIKMAQYAKKFRQLRLNQELHIKHDPDGNIKNLILVLNKTDELHIYKEDDQFDGKIRRIGTHTEIISAHGIVDSTVSAAAKQVGLSDSLLSQLTQLFKWDIDFDRKIQPGDQFSVIYEQHQFEGDIEEGDILAAEFVNQGKAYRALHYTDRTGATDYYTPMGDSLSKIPLLRAPLKYRRISSHFGTRKHPIRGKYNFHAGVDYAARPGTPIAAAGDGIVWSRARKGGYGKTIVLKHNQRVRTLYAHLLRYAKGLKVRDKVKRGQIIGYVGQSGRATGPHLHYEIQLDRVPKDPRKIELPISMPITDDKQAHFIRKTQKFITQLDTLSQFTTPAKLAQEILKPFTPAEAKLAITQSAAPLESVLKQHLVTFTATEQPSATTTETVTGQQMAADQEKN